MGALMRVSNSGLTLSLTYGIVKRTRKLKKHLPFCFSSVVCFLLCSVGLAQDAQAPPQSSLVVVNAISGTKNVFVSFDGESIWPPGFTAGQSTGAVMFPSGSKQLKIECEGYASTDAKLELPVGANCAIIIYPGEVVAEGPDKGKRRIGVFMPAPHHPGNKELTRSRWKAVLVGAYSSQEVDINGKKVVLTPRKSTEFVSSTNGVTVRHQGRDLLGVAPEEAGEYWVVIFPGDSNLQAVLLTHSPFKIAAD
jgi:hypothetical protein